MRLGLGIGLDIARKIGGAITPVITWLWGTAVTKNWGTSSGKNWGS